MQTTKPSFSPAEAEMLRLSERKIAISIITGFLVKQPPGVQPLAKELLLILLKDKERVEQILAENPFHPKRRTTRKKVAMPTDLRWQIWERDNFTCVYCGARRHLAVDHKIAEAKGGTLDPENLVTSCESCNSRKRLMDFDTFIKRTKRESQRSSPDPQPPVV